MELLFRFVSPPGRCSYLADQQASLEYELVRQLTADEYLQRMTEGWRRFGRMMFRPACPVCRACQSLRVVVDRFRPDRSQRRCQRTNNGIVTYRIGAPAVSRAKLALYDRYHAFQRGKKGWPEHPARDSASYLDSFVRQPFPVEEWCYYLDERLVGVGYVDMLPGPRPGLPGDEGGLSAIYFYYDPEVRDRSLGTWNVLSLIAEAARRRLPYVYLGYFVPGCASMEYKGRFVPNQLRGHDGEWRDFRT